MNFKKKQNREAVKTISHLFTIKAKEYLKC